MARTLLDYFGSPPTKTASPKEAKAQAPTPEAAPPSVEVAVVKSKKRERQPFPPIAPKDLPPSYFVSASYDGKEKKAVVKLYEPESGQIYFWYDNTGHQPYLLTNLSVYELGKLDRVINHQGFDRFETEEKLDPLQDKKVTVTKVVCKDPLAIGGRPGGTIRDIIPEDFPRVADSYIDPKEIKVWESKIKYYQTYIYDRQILPGMIYEIKNGNLVESVVPQAEESLRRIREVFKDCPEEEREFAEMWARLLEYPAPQFRRAAIDIEVYSPLVNRVPDAREGACPVIACSVYSSDGDKRV
ncbi:MAG: 3'-5' exonuclease, partial [Betaproteobacteria bacterium]